MKRTIEAAERIDSHITLDVIAAMREWVSDCQSAENCGADEFSAEEIVRGVERHFEGGVEGFLRSS